MTTSVLLLGATSGIASALARLYAEDGAALALVGRNQESVDEVARDLRARGASDVSVIRGDPGKPDEQEVILSKAFEALGTIDIAVLAWGNLPDQDQCERSAEAVLDQLRVNATSPIAMLTRLAPALDGQDRAASIAVLSSVAGDRGRRSNYAYGAAKAALSTFAEGLDARYRANGVNVSVIKPGFVATPMTATLDLPGPLLSQPERVARVIRRALRKRKTIAYAPSFWWAIMFIIRHLPSAVLRRLNI